MQIEMFLYICLKGRVVKLLRKDREGEGVAQLVECWPKKKETLSSITTSNSNTQEVEGRRTRSSRTPLIAYIASSRPAWGGHETALRRKERQRTCKG